MGPEKSDDGALAGVPRWVPNPGEIGKRVRICYATRIYHLVRDLVLQEALLQKRSIRLCGSWLYGDLRDLPRVVSS